MESCVVLCLAVITALAFPISKIFDVLTPTAEILFAGGYSSLLALPTVAYIITKNSARKEVKYATIFFSNFIFASAIDLIVSLQNDGILTGFMGVYLQKGEPYLSTAYSTAICYWDGIVHYALYWLILWKMSAGSTAWRDLSLYWFGTFWISVVILVSGSILGNYSIHLPILLNIPYFMLPVGFVVWAYNSEPTFKTAVRYSTTVLGTIVKYAFIIYFILATCHSLLRGMVAVGCSRWLCSALGIPIEKHIFHSDGYPRITVLLYAFYFVPYYVFTIVGLLSNKRTPLSVDMSLIHAGAAANAQIGYIGQAFVKSADHSFSFEFNNSFSFWAFWASNVALFIVPQLFAIYSYCCSSEVKVKLDRADKVTKTRYHSKAKKIN